MYASVCVRKCLRATTRVLSKTMYLFYCYPTKSGRFVKIYIIYIHNVARDTDARSRDDGPACHLLLLTTTTNTSTSYSCVCISPARALKRYFFFFLTIILYKRTLRLQPQQPPPRLYNTTPYDYNALYN